MSREYVDLSEEYIAYADEKDTGPFNDLPLKIELSFKSKRQLKRDVWDNARSHGWLV